MPPLRPLRPLRPLHHLRSLRALLLPLALLGSGCALLQPDEARTAGAAPPPPTVVLEVDAPRELERLLETHLDLARIGVLAPGEPVADSELRRLIAATPAQARSLLETEGYFNAEVTVERAAEESAGPARVRVRVDPGPRVHVSAVRIDAEGPLAAATAQGQRHADVAQLALREDWRLPVGAPFRNPDWSAAKATALAQLRAEGYVAATWAHTEARIDASTQQAELEARADSGALHRTGELRIQGLNHHDAQTVRNIANFEPGRIATERRLLDFQERLQASGLFDTATVVLEPDPADPAATPIVVRLAERRLQQATFGVGVSANVGARVSVEHTHRRPFGWAALARNKFELGQRRSAWDGEVSTHTLPGLYRNLVGGSVERIESANDVERSARLRIGRAQDLPRRSRLLFVEFERSLEHTDQVREESNALSLQYHAIWRRVDDVLLPTDGFALSLQGGVGQARSDPGGAGPFVRLWGRLVGYRPIGERWYGQARIELGQVISHRSVVAPASMRFRAGGEESVRGYAYRSLAPSVNGGLTGGNVVFTASAEIARPILERLPALWGAAFVDVGEAADRWSDLDPALGVGVGVRYRSPVGPLALDLAWGERTRKPRLHLSVGVTF